MVSGTQLNEKKKTFSIGKLRLLSSKLFLLDFCWGCVQTAMFELHIYMMTDVCMNIIAFYLCIHLTS